MKKITIAIDGFSSTGKSTLAKALAKQLGYVYVDTGAMYRAITLYAIQNHLIDNLHFNKEALIAALPHIFLRFEFNEVLGYGEIFLNNVKVEDQIRSLAVANLVSQVAQVSQVRAKLVEQQKEMGKNKGIVMDGRDIGTVVFPEAELKIFMTASPETRAKRRFEELKEKNQSVTFNEVLKNVEERDYLDTHRADSPLKQAKDAIAIDNSQLTKEAQLQIVLDLVKEKL